MTQIILETVKSMVVDKLKYLAQKHDRSLEAEITSILEDVTENISQNQQPDSERFWDGLQKFRQVIKNEGITFTDQDFADLRDCSVGREVDL